MLWRLQYLWVRSPVLPWRAIPRKRPMDGPASSTGLEYLQRRAKWPVHPPKRLGNRIACPNGPPPAAGYHHNYAGNQRSTPEPRPFRRKLRGPDGAVYRNAFGTGSALSIFLIAPPPMALGAWVDDPRIIETSQRLGVQYQAVAQELGIAFADANDWNVELAYDGVHFSEHGHKAFSIGISKGLAELAGDTL